MLKRYQEARSVIQDIKTNRNNILKLGKNEIHVKLPYINIYQTIKVFKKYAAETAETFKM